MTELKHGTSLQGGKYIIKRVLGQGGFGITYLAEHVSLGCEVAIKEFFMRSNCLRECLTGRVHVPPTGSALQVEQYRKKFLKEARMIASYRHPHIVNVVDVFEENGTAYYIMPYMEHGSLKSIVERNGRLPEADALHYIGQIADALRYVHQEKRSCHYDVKPDNILVDYNRNAVLIDFGISKNYDEHGNETSKTPIGMSDGFSPIEQYHGIKGFSPASDVYSLGATLYYLITGQVPPSAPEITQGVELKMDEISKETREIISSAMQVKSSDRPQITTLYSALSNRYKSMMNNISSSDSDSTITQSEENETTQTNKKSSPSQQNNQSKMVRCPKCGTLLEITNIHGNNFRVMSCPKCGTKLKMNFNTNNESDNNVSIDSAPTSTLPIGFILRSDNQRYVILSTIRETDLWITYRAKNLTTEASIPRFYLITERFEKPFYKRLPSGRVIQDTGIARKVSPDFDYEAQKQTGLECDGDIVAQSVFRDGQVEKERFMANGTDYFIVEESGFIVEESVNDLPQDVSDNKKQAIIKKKHLVFIVVAIAFAIIGYLVYAGINEPKPVANTETTGKNTDPITATINTDSICKIGNNYLFGESGYSIDYTKAVDYLRQAAELGHAMAQNNLGWCYKEGKGVEQNYIEAVKWYRKAADQGYAMAQFNLGWRYEHGEGVTKSREEAIKWYRKAAAQGESHAKGALKRLGVSN